MVDLFLNTLILIVVSTLALLFLTPLYLSICISGRWIERILSFPQDQLAAERQFILGLSFLLDWSLFVWSIFFYLFLM